MAGSSELKALAQVVADLEEFILALAKRITELEKKKPGPKRRTTKPKED